MRKQEWERKIMDLKQAQFKEVWARKQAEGTAYTQAAIEAYATVYLQEGK